MSTAANTPAHGVAIAPQLSKRALAELKKGGKVEIWVQCTPFKVEVNGATKVESEYVLFHLHRTLVKHFSPKWKRELAEDAQANRIHVPFPKEPVKLIVGWIVGGGGNDLNTPDAFYPKHDLRKLEILKSVASYLEIKSLVELFMKDILAWIPALPPVSIGSLVPKPVINKPIALEKLCWYCDKPGHIERDCPERSAVHVTKSQGETYAMN
ncbi:hypothetical protein HO173_004542 [Letharia columbiana]|uniref:CCHC-type domain-containing protein n=1 Tax=Letharia columbiana TaxID=112416 RepID=A0A8H6L651_9LECA|nr:uncharacterized protein HO173_004542 [Letharia columbiana]KAF6237075.1 hypothetical protein HO173_004542 [Letharia columbiana]